MKKYKMNKNVMHNGKNLPAGSELTEDMVGFKELVEQGHADVFVFKGEGEPDEAPPVEDEAPSEHKRKGRK